MMTFTMIETDRAYRLDMAHERYLNEPAIKDAKKRKGESFVNRVIDGMCDADMICKGSDGNLYAVGFDFSATPPVPLCWHRAVPKEDE